MDVARNEKEMTEFSLNRLSYDHLKTLHVALNRFIRLADNDLDLFTKNLSVLDHEQSELMVELCGYRKLALDLRNCMADVA